MAAKHKTDAPVDAPKLSKHEQMDAARKRFGQVGDLIPIPEAAPLEIFAKVMSVQEVSQAVERQAAFDENDPMLDARKMALELFDAEGNLYFDPDNDEDIRYLHNMGYVLRLVLSQASRKAAGWDLVVN